MVELLAKSFGLTLSFKAGGDDCWHPGRRALILCDGCEIGQIGEVHEEVAEQYGIEGKIYACQLLTDLLCSRPRISKPAPLPRFPAVNRDLAVSVEDRVPAGDMTEVILKSGGPLLINASIFDVYRGSQLGDGMKSIAWSLTFQSEDHTLTDDEVEAAFSKVLAALESEYGARIRK
jgi:phenylalanyl-tRNA synthetase beta chain